MESVMPPSPAAKHQAEEFFEQLEEFSTRVFTQMNLPKVSPWGSDSWVDGMPKGAILHYTADDTIERAVRWFMNQTFGAKASSNVVVGDKKVAWMDAQAGDLPLVRALPVTVLQCRKPRTESWHATWACALTYGIEATNIGELRQQPDGTFNCWYPKVQGAPEWTTPWKGAAPISVFGRWFCPWEPEQVKAIIQVLRHAHALLGTFQKPWVIGHEQIQGNQTRKWDSKNAPHYTTDKRDPGLHFPLEGIREALFDGDVDLDALPWFPQWSANQAHWALDQRRAWVQTWANGTTDAVKWAMGVDASWSAFVNHVHVLPSMVGPFGAVGKLALRLLGYHVSDVITEDLDSDDYQTIYLFQRLQGLDTDCQPGPVTRQSLFDRLRDRGLI